MSDFPVLHQQNRTPQFNAAYSVNSVLNLLILTIILILLKSWFKTEKDCLKGNLFL